MRKEKNNSKIARMYDLTEGTIHKYQFNHDLNTATNFGKRKGKASTVKYKPQAPELETKLTEWRIE